LLAVFLGFVFLAAAVGKSLDGNNFLVTVQYLSPQFLGSVPAYQFTIFALVIFTESFFGISLILTRKPSRVLFYAVLVLLIGFMMILVRMALDPWAPNCGCLGLLRIASKSDNNARIGIVRNNWFDVGLLIAHLGNLFSSEIIINNGRAYHFLLR